MKRILPAPLLLLLLLSPLPSLRAQETLRFTPLDSACLKAAVSHKPVLLIFSGSDWCKPCILLQREVLSTPAFTQFATENLVLLHADFPRSKKNRLSKAQQQFNDELAAKYNPEGLFPLLILLDENGKPIGTVNPGEPSTQTLLNNLSSLIRSHETSSQH